MRKIILKKGALPFWLTLFAFAHICHAQTIIREERAEKDNDRRKETAVNLYAAETTGQSSQSTPYVRPSARARFNQYLNNSIGPFALLGVGFTAGIDQLDKAPPEWKQGAKGYARRFASNFGESVIQETVSYGLEEAFKLDGKFYRSEKRDFASRLKNALLSGVTARTPSGRKVFNPSRIAGAYTGSILAAETWYPKRYSYRDGLRRGTQNVAAIIGFGLLNEFLFHRKK